MRKSGQFLENILTMVTVFVSLHRVVHSTLTVTPWEQSAQLGSEAKFFCSDDGDATKDIFLRWSFVGANNNNISMSINSTGRIKAENGTLTLTNLTYHDAGTYRCDNDTGSESATGVLIVYVMPDYLKEGLIIMGIGVALLVVVLIGTAILIEGQRRKKKARISEQQKRLLKRGNNTHK
ncbi:hypothetical protein BsWGS_03499 [Bradybaena similaris]